MLIELLNFKDNSFQQFNKSKGDSMGSADQIPRHHESNILLQETPKGKILRTLKIVFNKGDGSIHIEIPDYINEKGIFGTYNKNRVDETFSLEEKNNHFDNCAWSSSFMPKYSHHPDGVCTLSRSDRVYSVKNRSIPLNAMGVNDLCVIYIHNTSKFAAFKFKSKYKKQGNYISTLESPIADGDDGRMYRIKWLHRDLLKDKVVYDSQNVAIGFYAHGTGFPYQNHDEFFKKNYYYCHLFSPPTEQKYSNYVLAVGLEHQFMPKEFFSDFNRLEESVILRGGFTPEKPHWLHAIYPFEKKLIDESEIPSRNF